MDRRPVLLHALERGHRSRSRRSCRPSVAATRARVFPVWLGWVGAVLGLLWVIAGLGVATDNSGIFVLGFIAFLLWLVWILVISFFLFQPREQAASTP